MCPGLGSQYLSKTGADKLKQVQQTATKMVRELEHDTEDRLRALGLLNLETTSRPNWYS